MNRLQDFKNKGKVQEEMRRRRKEVTVELRKNKREEVISKMRNVTKDDSETEEDDQLPATTVLHSIHWKNLAKDAADFSKPEQQLAAVKAVRLISSGKNPPINDVIEGGMLPILVDCLKQQDNTMLQFEVALALTKITSGSSAQINQVVAAGAVPFLIQLLSSPAPNVSAQAVRALGNIIADGPELCDHVLKLGILQPLLAVIKPDKPIKDMRNVTWVIANLCCDNEPPLPAATISEILPALVMLLHHTDTYILVGTMWAINHLTDMGTLQIQMIMESTIVPKVIALLGHAEVQVQSAALRAVANIVAGSDEQTQVVLNLGVLSYFPALLTHTDQEVRGKAIWLLSNIVAGTHSQIEAVIDMGLLPKIIEYLQKGEFQIQREATWAVRNFTATGNGNQIFRLIKEGVIPPYCDMLSCQDNEVIALVLEGLTSLLKMPTSQLNIPKMIEECGGLKKVETLQTHENVDISKMACELIQKYFSDEGEEANLAPTSDGTQFQFDPDSDEPMNPFQF